MTNMVQFSDGPLDGVKFECPFAVDDLIIRRVDGPCYAYECDWTCEIKDVILYNMVENRFYEEEFGTV